MMPRGRPGRARCVEGQTARPRTSAPVAAAPSQERAHIALARNAHAQRAVDEGLGLNSAARSDAGDLGQRQLTRQNHACKTQRGQTARTVQALHAHLRGAVQRQARRHSAHKRGHGQILRDDGVTRPAAAIPATASARAVSSPGYSVVFSVTYTRTSRA